MEKKEKVSKILLLKPLLSNLMTSHHAGNLSIYFQIVPVLKTSFKEKTVRLLSPLLSRYKLGRS